MALRCIHGSDTTESRVISSAIVRIRDYWRSVLAVIDTVEAVTHFFATHAPTDVFGRRNLFFGCWILCVICVQLFCSTIGICLSLCLRQSLQTSCLGTMTLINTGSLLGGLASASLVFLWLYTFHERFFISVFKTLKVTGYGVYVEFGEALRSHHWFLIKGLIQKPKREALEEEVKDLSETVGRDSSYGAGHPLLSKQFLLPDQNYLGKSPCRKGTEPHTSRLPFLLCILDPFTSCCGGWKSPSNSLFNSMKWI
jgi:hypothetical protein